MMVYVDRPNVQTLEVGSMVSKELVMNVGEDVLRGFLHHNMAMKLAEALEPNIEYKVVDDPIRGQYIVKGRVRILPPGYRF